MLIFYFPPFDFSIGKQYGGRRENSAIKGKKRIKKR
jgi:hypothetical protein